MNYNVETSSSPRDNPTPRQNSTKAAHRFRHGRKIRNTARTFWPFAQKIMTFRYFIRQSRGTPSPKMSARRHFSFFAKYFAFYCGRCARQQRAVAQALLPVRFWLPIGCTDKSACATEAGIKASATWEQEEGGVKPPLRETKRR
jgi:hypothetical protein